MRKEPPLSEIVDIKATRKLRSQKIESPGIWFGLGTMGLIGWSVAVPTLLGAGLGIWLDRQFPEGHSYTLALLVAGLCLGCFNAWHWLSKEQREMHETDEPNEPQEAKGAKAPAEADVPPEPDEEKRS